MQLEPFNSETIIIRAASLGLSEFQGFEGHAPEYRSCTSNASKVIRKWRPGRRWQDSDQR
jgi:hypothetical protein